MAPVSTMLPVVSVTLLTVLSALAVPPTAAPLAVDTAHAASFASTMLQVGALRGDTHIAVPTDHREDVAADKPRCGGNQAPCTGIRRLFPRDDATSTREHGRLTPPRANHDKDDDGGKLLGATALSALFDDVQAQVSPTTAPAAATAVQANVTAVQPEEKASFLTLIVLIAQSLLLFLSACVVLCIMVVGLRLQLFSPCWDYLQSPGSIGFIVAFAFVGQSLGLLSKHCFEPSFLHISTWVCRCIQDECVCLVILVYFIRLEYWQRQWRRLQPFAPIYEKIMTAPKLGECAPSTMLVSGVGAIVLLLLNFPAAMGVVFIGGKFWPDMSPPVTVHGIDLVFPYVVLGLCTYLTMRALARLDPQFAAACTLMHETWVCAALFSVGAVVQIVCDSKWLFSSTSGRDAHIDRDKPVFQAGVIDVWSVAFHCNLVILLCFMHRNQSRCEPLPRPFEAQAGKTVDGDAPADSMLWAKTLMSTYHSEVGPLALVDSRTETEQQQGLDAWYDSLELEFEDAATMANDSIPVEVVPQENKDALTQAMPGTIEQPTMHDLQK